MGSCATRSNSRPMSHAVCSQPMRVISLTCHVGRWASLRKRQRRGTRGCFSWHSCHAGRSKRVQRVATCIISYFRAWRLGVAGRQVGGRTGLSDLSLPVVLFGRKDRRQTDGTGCMQGDMASQRSCARNPTCILIYAYPFPARAASRPSFRCCCCCCGSHGNGSSARPSGGVGGSCHGISCVAASLVRCRTTTSLGRARDRRCSVGARAGRQWTIDDMCVCCMCAS